MRKYRLPRQTRVALAVVGVVLILAALAVLSYALWPAEMLNLRSTLAPSLLTPPVGVAP